MSRILQRYPVLVQSVALPLLLGLVILRIPSFLCALCDPDEAHYLVMGRMLSLGSIPYVDVVDKKPILTYLFYAPAGYFGFSMVPMKILGVLWALGTCLILFRAGSLWQSDRRVGLGAAWLYALISSCNNLAIHSELMMNLPLSWALLCFVRGRQRDLRASLRDDWLCGLAIGLASLFRHQAGIVLLGIVPAMLWHGVQKSERRWLLAARVGLLGVGSLSPWLLVTAVYARLGHLTEFYEWNIARNFFYIAKTSSGSSLGRLLIGLLLYVLLAAPLPWLWSLREGTRAREPIRIGLLIGLLATWIPVSMSGRYYSQYFVQFAVPLSLLAAPSLAGLGTHWSERSRRSRRLWTLGLLGPVIFYLGYGIGRRVLDVLPYPSQDPRSVAIGDWVRSHSDPRDTLLVWGYIPPIYPLAQRLPGTRYVTTAVHIGDIEPSHVGRDFSPAQFLSDRDIARTIADLQSRQPLYVIDTAPTDLTHFSPFPLRVAPDLYRYVIAHYELVSDTPGGAQIYRRLPRDRQ